MAGEHAYTYFTTDTNLGDADQNTDALLKGYMWDLSGSTVLTYSFPDSSADISYTLFGGAVYANAFNAAQQAAAVKAMALFASVIDATFIEAADNADGTLRFFDVTGISTAFGYYPYLDESAGDMVFKNGTYESPDVGTYAFLTVMHELGHSMGLKHGHDTSDSGALTADKDGMEYSVMTYNSFVGQSLSPAFYTNPVGHYAQTLMMYDIAALQRMYGPNWAENSSDSTYTFDLLTGEMSINGVGQGASTANIIFRTVWDGDGVDTYDLSNFTTKLLIDLSSGSYSDFDVDGTAQRAKLNSGYGSDGTWEGESAEVYASGHLYNALQFEGNKKSLIENATGGSANDKLIGNGVDNVLIGNGGKDILLGANGKDTLKGGSGRDTLKGGKGADIINGGNGGDKIIGGKGDDKLTGKGGADKFIFKSGEGNDIITDFNDGFDLIKITSGAASFADITLDVSGNGTLVSFDDVTIKLKGVDIADIDASDFLF